MNDSLSKFLGDTPLRLLVKLVIVSIVTGFVMKAFGWYPMDVYYSLRNFILRLWHTGFAALGEIGDYLVLGAAIVIPVFIVIRILSYRR
jgi:hypothetical protein